MTQIENNDTSSHNERILNTIKVQKFDLTWMFRDDKNFTDFVVVLNKSNKKEIFSTKFVESLLDQFWLIYKSMLVKWMFVPFLMYACCSISYMYFTAKK